MKRTIFAALLLLSAGWISWAQTLQLEKTIPLPGVQGKFDHLAADDTGERLFVAATGNHSVEVVDLKTGTIKQSIGGLGKPHGLAWVAQTASLYVADGGLGELRVYRGKPLKLVGTIKLSDDADDMVYDDAAKRLYVGHGGSDAANPPYVAIVDTSRFALVANLPVNAHPEALDLDEKGRRVFINVADANEVAVLNVETNAISSVWKISDAADNVPLAFDSNHALLFVACRTPGKLLALNAATGTVVASATSAGKADDLFYDASRKRIYLVSGAGEVDSYELKAGSALQQMNVTTTVPGAKTGLFVASNGRMYIAVPGTPGTASGIRVYKATDGK
ncbi:MAG: hypothetical protein P4L40_02990 [Terracidiphilus sp.]|nr:hypothetical protein [Terracidiphilus sp.]